MLDNFLDRLNNIKTPINDEEAAAHIQGGLYSGDEESHFTVISKIIAL